MSFVLSPQAIIFDIERQIEQLEASLLPTQIFLFEAQEKLDAFNQLNPNPGTAGRLTQTNLLNTVKSAQSEISLVTRQIETLKDQIPILEVDLSAKQELGIVQAPIDLSSLENLVSNLTGQLGTFQFPQIQPETITIQAEPKDNTLRNALLVGGAILLLV